MYITFRNGKNDIARHKTEQTLGNKWLSTIALIAVWRQKDRYYLLSYSDSCMKVRNMKETSPTICKIVVWRRMKDTLSTICKIAVWRQMREKLSTICKIAVWRQMRETVSTICKIAVCRQMREKLSTICKIAVWSKWEKQCLLSVR
jgi:3-dehydroquinate dehydratase